MSDFIGWACETCRRELNDCTLRLFCGAAEETEPGE